MKKALIPAVAALVVAAAPLFAGDRFEMPVSGEILPGWQLADGTRVAGIRLNLAPGWKTYWRTPGDAGIPPQISWKGSSNLAGARIVWPAPQVFATAGMRTIGYTGDIVLPVALAPKQAGKPLKLKADLDIGVCSDICIPHNMQLTATISDTNTSPTPAIAAALAAQPYSAQEAGVTSANCAIRPSSDGMAITATLSMPHAGGEEVVIIEPGPEEVWMSETVVRRSGATLVAEGEMMLASGGAFAIDRSDIRITVLGKKHAVDIKGCAPG